MMRKCVIVSLIFFTSACAQLPEFNWWPGEEDDVTQSNAPQSRPMQVLNVQGSDASPVDTEQGEQAGSMDERQRTGYMSEYRGQHIGTYVQSLAQDLISNMEYVSEKTPLGVTHFALLDSDLQKTNVLGLQIAESFMHELHQFHIPVIDYKGTDYIRVTPGGDFFLTRDFLEVNTQVPLQYVLTGTLTRHHGGYLVNARVLGVQSKRVVASAQTLIPFQVVDALLGDDKQSAQGVTLKQG